MHEAAQRSDDEPVQVSDDEPVQVSDDEPVQVSLAAAARAWAEVGLNSFGGPAGQIAVIHRLVVERRRWVDEQRFLRALNYCMLLPGPEAQQLATYIGWLINGFWGGLIAGVLFVVPGVVAIGDLSVAYVEFQDTAVAGGMFYGVKPIVIAIVAASVVRISRRALAGRLARVTAVAAFTAILLLAVPFPFLVAGAALAGWIA